VNEARCYSRWDQTNHRSSLRKCNMTCPFVFGLSIGSALARDMDVSRVGPNM
jgi:hypothetical protein